MKIIWHHLLKIRMVLICFWVHCDYVDYMPSISQLQNEKKIWWTDEYTHLAILLQINWIHTTHTNRTFGFNEAFLFDLFFSCSSCAASYCRKYKINKLKQIHAVNVVNGFHLLWSGLFFCCLSSVLCFLAYQTDIFRLNQIMRNFNQTNSI